MRSLISRAVEQPTEPESTVRDARDDGEGASMDVSSSVIPAVSGVSPIYPELAIEPRRAEGEQGEIAIS